MHSFIDGDDDVAAPRRRRRALIMWVLCVLVLIGPSLLVWAVRGVAFAYHCTPGPDLCHGMPLGGGLRDTLNLAWFAGVNTTLTLAIALVAAVAGLCERKPLMAALSIIVLPLAALLLPTLAVLMSGYDGCKISESGVGDCTLWGGKMGMAFHTAAQTTGLVYDFMPYAVSLSLMLGLVGFLFLRPKRN